jgi:peptidoglycan/xylan/chitin deacetylase (PgdA/CDA1 family)
MGDEGFLTSVAGHMKTAVVRIVASTLFHSGALNALQTRTRRNIIEKTGLVPQVFPFGVLLYHRVNSDADPYFPRVSTEVFDAQMNYLARHYRVLSLGEILGRIENGLEVQPYTIAITFDDGYRDNFTYAHPILKKYRLPATLFVATGHIGSDGTMWNDRVSWAFKHTGRKDFALEIANRRFVISLRSTKDRIRSLSVVLEILKAVPDSEKSRILDSMVKELNSEGAEPPRLMLSWGELRQMVEEGWEIGSHTVNHVILTRVQASVVNDELRKSKETLQKELQCPISLFAYPNGKQPDFDLSIKDLVREAGYKAAVTTLDGLNDRSTDPFEIRRRSPWEPDLPCFATRLLHVYWKRTKQTSWSDFCQGRWFYETQT